MEKSPHYRFTLYSQLLSHTYKIGWQIHGSLMCLDLKAYKLTSTSMLRKYSSILDVPFSYITSNIRFVSGWRQIWTAQVHVTNCIHWFEKVFIMLQYILTVVINLKTTIQSFTNVLPFCSKIYCVSEHSHNAIEMLHSTIVLLCYSHIC